MESNKLFAMTGVAGYIAPRHIKAIKETGNKLIASTDPSDSVGVMDSFFLDVRYYREYIRFESYLERLVSEGKGIDYLTICSPNYLHYHQIQFGLSVQAKIVCEKPLVLEKRHIDSLCGHYASDNIFTIQQLRFSPIIADIASHLRSLPKPWNIKITYQINRGFWYAYNWQMDEYKSGGILFNIGIHPFDILTYLCGEFHHYRTTVYTDYVYYGYLQNDNAKVDILLEIGSDLNAKRIMIIEGIEFDLTKNLTDLHTECYKNILEGKGTTIEQVKPTLNLLYNISRGIK